MENIWLTFDSSLTALCEKNSSFDAGKLRIAYPGLNRNGSFISRDAFESALSSINNVPVVAHYIREDDELGGHDMEVVSDAEGNLRLVNLTTPVGVVPESARQWWEEVEEKDGSTHEYLCTEVLLWKRQEAYEKIKEEGITAQSMEITVKDGKMKDGVYYIDNFEFNAFALLGVEPCFESASLETFSMSEFKAQLSQMMDDLRESFSMVTAPEGVDDKHPQAQTEGGETKLDNQIMPEVEEEVVEEVAAESFEEAPVEPEAEPVAEPEAETETDQAEENTEPETADEEAPAEESFVLNSNQIDSICEALREIKIETEWGVYPRYWFVDVDFEKSEVYAMDEEDWHLYGFPFAFNGDVAEIDWEGRARKKWIIADFDEGESRAEELFSSVSKKLTEARVAMAEFSARVKEADNQIGELNSQIAELEEFKQRIETEVRDSEIESVFAQFEDLTQNEEFVALVENHEGMDAEALAEKCYAIRGRAHSPAKFSLERKNPKLKIDHKSVESVSADEPYGDLFERYGNK